MSYDINISPDILISIFLIIFIVFLSPKLSTNLLNSILSRVIFLILIFYVVVYKEYITTGIFLFIIFFIMMYKNYSTIENFKNNTSGDEDNEDNEEDVSPDEDDEDKKKEIKKEEDKKKEKDIKKENEVALILEQNRHNKVKQEHKQRMKKLNEEIDSLKFQLDIKKSEMKEPEPEEESEEEPKEDIKNKELTPEEYNSINDITLMSCGIINDTNLSMKQFSLRHADHIVRKLPKGSEYGYNYIANMLNDNDSARSICYGRGSVLKPKE
jgi:uncharacterized membrane protein YgaE (UPF0421/DUF939 family)